ncbi:MAG TPA: histidine kinase [Phnomibacter sp.]|nr:histidine kinase [Phnomibacter sp.]
MKNIGEYIAITVAFNFVLIASIIYIFLISQRKKTRYLQQMQQMREEQQNLLIEAAVRSEETERHRIAEQLHDEVGALLSATKLHFSAAANNKLGPDELRVFARSKELLDISIQKVRSISHNLHSSILKELGLCEAIRHFVHQTTHDTQLITTLKLDEACNNLDDDREVTVYRLFQELLNNILKHSEATMLSVHTHQQPNTIVLELLHNGKGLSQSEFERLRYESKGLGLKNIQNRIILLKGDIHYQLGVPTHKVTVTIPHVPE